MTYPAAFIFKVPSTAYLSMACGNMLVGITTVLSTYILDFLGNDDEVGVSDLSRCLYVCLSVCLSVCLTDFPCGNMLVGITTVLSAYILDFVDNDDQV